MRYVDLHVHSTASDGTFSPEALVDYALQKQLAAVALTDHDTIAVSYTHLDVYKRQILNTKAEKSSDMGSISP